MHNSGKILFTLFLFIFLLTQACSNNENENPRDLTFKVNQTLLGEKFIDNDLGFSFSPPKSCLPISEEKIQKINDRLKKETAIANSIGVEPHTVFLNENDQFVCVISILPTLSDADSANAAYQQAIESHYKNSQVSQADFNHNGLKIYQSLITNQNIVQFKLVVIQSQGKSFQIDYVIQKLIYQDNLEAIESSIGSLTKLKES